MNGFLRTLNSSLFTCLAYANGLALARARVYVTFNSQTRVNTFMPIAYLRPRLDMLIVSLELRRFDICRRQVFFSTATHLHTNPWMVTILRPFNINLVHARKLDADLYQMVLASGLFLSVTCAPVFMAMLTPEAEQKILTFETLEHPMTES
jgi:hypothetical protein